MDHTQFDLLKTKRFLPLFVTQALGALNDNVFKNAMAILMVYKLAEAGGYDKAVLATAAGGVFILPFFLFSATAGQLADKYDKAMLIRNIKLAEILIMALGAAALFVGQVVPLFVVLFLMGMQSTFFGPLKYSILPVHLNQGELIGANSLVEAGTFLAILAGTIAGGLLILTTWGVEVVSVLVLALAAAGYAASLGIPSAPAPSPSLTVNWNVAGESWRMVSKAFSQRFSALTILGISWFWLVGATFLSLFPAIVNDILKGDETVVTLFLVLFTVGVAIGSMLCNRLLKGEVTAIYAPFGALGITVFVADFAWSLMTHQPPAGASAGALVGGFTFMGELSNWRMMVDLLGVAVCGGIFIVPLYAILQARSDEADRSRTIAANNIVNAFFMTAGAGIVAALIAMGFGIPAILLVIAGLNLIVALYVTKLLPDAVIKAFLVGVLKLLFRVEVKGLEHYSKAGERAVIVVNHVSFLDPVLLAAFLPVKPLFAVNTHIAQAWWVAPFLRLVDAFPMDPTNPMAAKALVREVKKDKHCVIFPEGRITVTGALMKVFDGPAMIADQADAMLVPVRIDGAQYTMFSRLKGKVRRRWFPKITLTVLPPRKLDVPEGAVGKTRRRLAGQQLYDVMSDMVFETCNRRRSLFDALLEARAAHGGSHAVIEDIERSPLSYDKLVLGARILGRKLAARTRRAERVGVMVPNSMGAVVTFFALQSQGRVPAMLNFSAGVSNMLAAIKAAEIRTVLTSRRFVEMARLQDVIEAFKAHVDVVYLEDVKASVSTLDKVRGLLSQPFADALHSHAGISPDEPAVVLFTSGSEGTPKGVVLSHANLLANCYQLSSRVDFNPQDIVFNALPVFHSFGLTGGTLLPVLSGVKAFMYPSPLHYRIVPALVYDTNATIMFGTDTFLAGYARSSDPYDFYSVRYVFAGAEKVKDETRKVWSDKFGIRIFEGYGATETSPAIATNTAQHFKAGSVGRFLPGITHRLEPVPGIDEGGRLIVTGPNVMLGYLKADNPGVIEPAEDSTYDTGDIVDVDERGFVTILGRAKRFAKIAGEMVSLTAVEAQASSLWPDHMHAVVAVPDAKKGEQLVLITGNDKAKREDLQAHCKTAGLSELMVPKTVLPVKQVPLLGTGKIDYVAVQALAQAGQGK
jgi:acyl-[acyl-carrier-protein]-phospholipid O-acyltransferase/long-chain-fatty-acid--[acyl-carrier-protein] ligase